MKERTFEKAILINSDVATVMDVISNYDQYERIDPLIEKVERAEQSPPGVERFFVTTRFQWGLFRFKIKYRADMISVTEDTVHAEAHHFPGIHVTNRATVSQVQDGVILHEAITMRAPDLLFDHAFRPGKPAHEDLLKRIKSFVEAQD